MYWFDSPVKHPFLNIRFRVYPPVHVYHNEAGSPKRHCTRYHSVCPVHFERTIIRMFASELQVLVRGVPSHEYGKEGEQRGRTPNDREHNSELVYCHDQGVIQWLNYRIVAIDANAAQVQYANSGEVHVQTAPHVAHEVSEEPFSIGEDDTRIKAHGPNGDEHVS